MKKVIKVIAVIVLIFIVLLFLGPIIFKGKIIETAKEEINKNVNAKVEFADFNVSLFKSFPNFSFGIEEFTIIGHQPFEKDTLAKIDNLEVTIDLLSVIGGSSFEIRQINVVNPDIKIKVLEDGTTNYDIAVETETSEPALPEEESTSSFVLTLKKVILSGGKLVYDDKSLATFVLLEGLEHTLSGDLTVDETTLKTHTTAENFTLYYEGIPYFSNTRLDYSANINADLANEIYTLKKNMLKLNDLFLTFEGSVSMIGDDINTVMTFEAPKAGFKNFLSLVPAIYTKDFENVKTSGDLAIDGFVKGIYNEENLPAFGVNINVDDAMFSYPDMPASVTKINIATAITNEGGDADNTVVDVSKFTMKMGNNPMAMQWLIKTPVSDPDINGSINGKLDLSTIKDFYPLEDGEELSGQFTADITLKGKLSAIENEQYEKFTAIGSLLVQNFTYGSSLMPNPVNINNAQLNFSPQYLDLVNFTMATGNSDFKASGKIENYLAYALSDGVLTGELKTFSNYFNLSDLMPEYEETEETEASETSDSTSYYAPVEIPANIDFEMAATFKELIYDNIEMTNVGGRIYIRDQKMVLDNLSMNILDGEMEVNGSYFVPEENRAAIDFDLDIREIDIQNAYNTFSIISKYAPIAKKTSGRFSTEMKLITWLDEELNPMYETMVGGGKLLTTPVTIRDVNTLNKIAETLKMDEIKRMVVDKIQFEFEFIDGKIKVEPFDMKAGNFRANLGGMTGFDQSIDYLMNMSIPREKLGSGANQVLTGLVEKANAGGANFSLGDEVDLDLLIAGTLLNPTVKADLAKGAGNLKEDLKQKAQEELEKKKEEVSKEARERAQKILDDADKQAKKLVDEAEKQADNIRKTGAQSAEKIRKEADDQAEKLIAEGKKKGFLAEAAAKEAAKKLRKEADESATKVEQEADQQALGVVRNANNEANRIKTKAREEADKILNRN